MKNKTIQWKQVESVHLIGIGGIGISALARLLLHNGKKISGTEDNESHETLDGLRAQGVEISLSLEDGDLPSADVYVYSDAWLTKHPAVLEAAKEKGTPVLSYFEALGQLANSYKLIAVAGAHGKTTTTAMFIDVLEEAGLDPTAVVGSLRAKTKSNFRAGEGEYFIVEADEYRRHFLQFSPYMLIITNIDADHLDYYRDIADIQSAFKELVMRVPADGYVICDTDDERVLPVTEGAACHVVNYMDYFDANLPLRILPLNLPNAAAVLAGANFLGVDEAVARRALSNFAGTWRRFEHKGKTVLGAHVYDDYGHHPTEIAAVLSSARQLFPEKRIIVAFQPHLYSRTKALMDEFTSALLGADEVLLAPIFAAREEPDPSVSSTILAQHIQAAGGNAESFGALPDIARDMARRAREGDILITMGAGDIYTVADTLTQK